MKKFQNDCSELTVHQKPLKDHSPLGKLGRRSFLKGSMATSATLLAAHLAGKKAHGADEDYGVASGDPRADSVVIWTKIPSMYRASIGNTSVQWEVATDPNFTALSLVQEGSFDTHSDRDFTVKVKVQNLDAFTRYYYRFFTDSGYESVIGRTLTAPNEGLYASTDIHFAYVSCSNYNGLHWNVYKALAEDTDLHFCVHLGDNVYEHYLSGQAKTLADWRLTYELLLSLPEVREARRLFPWIYTWDDHEVYNNFTGAGEETNASDRQIQGNAYQSWWENTPVDPAIEMQIVDDIPVMKIYRKFLYGRGIELFALDGRQYRDGVVCGREILVSGCDDLYDPERSKLGDEQNAWLTNGLHESQADWKFLLNQCMMMPLKLTNKLLPIFEAVKPQTLGETSQGYIINLDQWDGYPANRAMILEDITSSNIENVVVLTGDIHNCYVGELKTDFTSRQSKAIGVEFVTSSITSYGIAEYVGGRDLTSMVTTALAPANPHMKWVDAYYHTYGRITVGERSIQNAFIAVSTVDEAEFEAFELKAFQVDLGDATVKEVQGL